MAPALRIPVSVDLETLKKQMGDASSHVGTATRQIAKQFLDMNKEMAAGAGASALNAAGGAALKLAGRVALVVGAAKLMGDAISGARDQLKDMVDLADKSQNLGVSSSFLQSARAESKKLQIGVEDLDGALQHAFNATKDKSPVDLGAWDTGKDRITEVERALRIYNGTVAKASGNQLEGLVLFRDADTQEKKITAVLKAMIQLKSIGQESAALDLGEKMFGSAFVDRIRQGRASAEGFLKTIQSAKGDADGIFPDALVRRAKDMDDQLKVAHQRLTTALKPSWDDLAGVLLTIKGYWSDTIGLIAKAVELSNQIKIPGLPDNSLQGKRDALTAVNKRLAGEDSGGILNSAVDGLGRLISGDMPTRVRQELELRRHELQGQIANEESNFYGPDLPKPKTRGTGDAPTLKPTGGATRDRFDTSADSIDKRTAALEAETRTIDLGTEARDRARVVAQLETVAMQANAAAGKGAGVVTAEQRDRINEVADAYGKATVAIEKATIASEIKRGSQTALLDPQDVAIANQLKGIYPDVATALSSVEASAMRTNQALSGIAGTLSSTMTTGLTDMLDGTKSVSAGFSDMSKIVIRAMMEMVVKMAIVQPIMRGMSGLFGFSGGGAVPLPGAADFIGPVLKADGGPIDGPGTATSDSIPARLSRGEYVINAAATAQHRQLLDQINSGKLPRLARFADGGFAGGGTGMMMGGNQTTIAPTINVSVQGSPGASRADHEAMGANIAKSVEVSVRKLVADELRTQRRPGGILR